MLDPPRDPIELYELVRADQGFTELFTEVFPLSDKHFLVDFYH